jgi:hypothetical protein
MRPNNFTVTRRGFFAGSTAAALSTVAMSQAASAFPAARSVGALGELDLGEAVILSAQSCARDGFITNSWLHRPFEADLLRDNPTIFRAVALQAAEAVSRRSFRAQDFTKLQVINVPKNKHGALRTIAITEPVEALAYLTLAVMAAPIIEANKTSADANIVHSHRFSPHRQGLFNPSFTFASFAAVGEERATKEGFVVSCDLANCYGSLHSQRVADSLEKCGVAGWQVDYISELLDFWKHDASQGLPIGPMGSSILAEAVLLQIDSQLHSRGIDFVRYVDDFRLFSSDEKAARLGLDAVVDAASSQGLALNSEKTRFLQFVKAEDLPAAGQPQQIRQLRVAQARSGRRSSAGYAEILPRNFRRASIKEIDYLRRFGGIPDASAFLGDEIAPPSKLRRAIRLSLYGGHDKFIRVLPAILNKYPEFWAYASCALCKASEFVSADLRAHLRNEFSAVLLDPATPDFVALRLVDVLAHPDYRDQGTLLRFVRRRLAEQPGLDLRAALDAIRAIGGFTPDIKRRFAVMDGWARRALLADPDFRRSAGSSANNDLFTA